MSAESEANYTMELLTLAEQEELTKRLVVVLTPGQLEGLRAVSRSRKMSMSSIARIAMMTYCMDRFPEFTLAYYDEMKRNEKNRVQAKDTIY